MSITKKTLGAGLAIAAAALLTTGCQSMGIGKYSKASTNAVTCFGINACKGQSTCATHLNACSGQNACKGKGVMQAASKEDCEGKGGTVYDS